MNLSTLLRLPTNSYFPEKHAKDLIILHHTVGGSAKSTFEYWRTDQQRIGTAYIVERDGTIYEVWAYHLGLKTTSSVDKRSIGIEIASEGALLEREGKYYAFGRLAEFTQYTGSVYDVTELNAAGSFTTVSSSAPLWRDYRYFAQYTPAALASVFALVDHLLTVLSIPRQTPANHVDFDLPEYMNYQGVLTHCQLRRDKSDVHPGFAWNQLIAYCGLQPTHANNPQQALVATAAMKT